MILTDARLLFGSFSSTVAKSSLAWTYLVKPLLATARLSTAVHSTKQSTIIKYLINEKIPSKTTQVYSQSITTGYSTVYNFTYHISHH